MNTRLKITDFYGHDKHWEKFDAIRKKHNDNICSETNKLVLRLDKLVNSDGEDGGLGKNNQLDKSVVEWTLDDLVKLCPYCAKSFTIARRRHHCRACGAILCNNCSKFLDHKAACKLVKPAKLYTDPYDRIDDQLQNRKADEMPRIRTCEDCKRLLDRRIQIIEDRYDQPIFLDFYDKLRNNIAEADGLILSQSSVSSSGERQTVVELRSKIHDLRQNVGSMSKKLNKMIEQEQVSGRQAYLMDAIRQSIGAWLKETIRDKEARVVGRQSSTDGIGWVPEQRSCSADDSNPNENILLTQLKNVEKFIEQAKKANRYEEVSVLETNKRELENEYFLQQTSADCKVPIESLRLDDDDDNDELEEA